MIKKRFPKKSYSAYAWLPLPAILRQKYYRYVVELSREIEIARGFLTSGLETTYMTPVAI